MQNVYYHSKEFFVKILLILIVPFTATECLAALSVDDIIHVLQERESAIRSVRYEMTQVKHRTAEGTKLLEKLRPGTVLKLDEPEAPQKRDLIRIRDGEKDFVKNILYSDDLKIVVGHSLNTWDGSIGKYYSPKTNSGRIERKHFSVPEEFPEKTGLELKGKPLHEWLTDRRETIQIKETPNGILVEFEFQPKYVARYLLDPRKGFLPISHEILSWGEMAFKIKVNKFEHYNVDGVDVYFPVNYESTMFIPDAARTTDPKHPKMTPLLVTKVEVTKVEFNPIIPDGQFDIEFSPDTSVYDEFLGGLIPTREVEKILQEAIDEQVTEYSSKLLLKSRPAQQKTSTREDVAGEHTTQEHDKQELINQETRPHKDRGSHSWFSLKNLIISVAFLAILTLFFKVVLSRKGERGK